MLIAGAILAVGADAQEPRPLRLGAPTAVYAEPFSRVGGLVEQSDGRELVLDAIESRILRIDLTSGRAKGVGRQGQGPGEYTLPLSLVSIRGDTTIAVDMTGGGRALVITKDGVSDRGLRSAGSGEVPLFYRTDIQADSLGRLYELVRQAPGMASTPSQVSRLDRTTGERRMMAEVSELGRSPLSRPSGGRGSDEPQAARSGGPPPPFASIDQWAVSPDGRVAVVTVEPFRVTYHLPGGGTVAGQPIAYQPSPVTRADREAWMEERRQLVPSLTYGPNRTVSAGRIRPRVVEPDQWPSELPPFLPKALRFAPDGNLWIARATPAGEPALFDMIGRDARLIARIVLPDQTRLVGFGRASVYIVRVDSDGLEYLERRPLPRLQ